MPMKVSYKGRATITHKQGSTVTSRRTIHNAGLPDIAKMFAKAASGTWTNEDDAPRLLDIGYIVDSSDVYGTTSKMSVWESILNKPVPIGGRQYSYDDTENNWIATLTTTVLWSDLNGIVIDKALEDADNDKIQLQIRLCSYPEQDRKYFAKIDLEPSDIRKIQETTSAIVTWVMELVLDDSNSITTSGAMSRK